MEIQVYRKNKSGYLDIAKILIPLLVALEAADGIFTFSAVGRALIREGNPLMRDIAGSWNYLSMKIFGALICGLLLWSIFKRFPRISLVITSGILLFYAVVLIWNLDMFFKFNPL